MLLIPHSIKPGEVTQVLYSAHFVIEQRRMGHVADLVAYLMQIGAAQQRNRASRRLGQPGKAAQQCSFPCSVVAQDGVHAGGGKLSGHAAQGGKPAKLLHDSVDSDDGTGGISHDSL